MRAVRFWLFAPWVALSIPAVLAAATSGEPYAAVVQRVAGDVRVTGPGATSAEAKVGDVPDSGSVFATGPDGFLVLRFHPDFMTVEAQAGSRLQVDYARADSGGARRVALTAGRVLTGLTAKGPGLRLEDAHSTVRAGAGRISFATGPKGSTIFVLEGEAVIQNRATGKADKVGRGGKAVSGPGGTVVTRADARELAAAGHGRNRLEIDFWNPSTREVRTLEVEYESRP